MLGQSLHDNPATAPPFRGPRVHSNVARPARNVAAGPPRPQSSPCWLLRPVWSLGLNVIGGPDPRPIFRQASNGGSFDASQPPNDRCVAGPTQTGLRCRVFADASLAHGRGRQCMQKSACFTSELPRLELQKTACARETARRTAEDARSARLAEDGEFAASVLRAAGIDSRARAG